MRPLFSAFVVLGGLFAVVPVAFAQNAVLYTTPATVNVAPGQTFQVTVMVNTGGEQVNAVAAYLTYPENLLEGVSIDTTGSALDTFTPERTVGNGRVEFAAAKQPPPISGVQKVFSVTFRAKNTLGNGTLAFTTDSAVLTHAESKNILSLAESTNGQFQITQSAQPLPPPPTPQPSPEPTPPAGGPTPSPAQEELQITDVTAEQIGSNSIRITWNTNKPADARIDYGVDNAYNFSVIDGRMAQDHSVVLENLESEGTYQFRIQSATQEGEVAFFEALSLEELFGGQEVEITPPGNNTSANEEGLLGGFEMNTTSVILLVVLALVVLGSVFLVFWRIRQRRAAA